MTEEKKEKKEKKEIGSFKEVLALTINDVVRIAKGSGLIDKPITKMSDTECVQAMFNQVTHLNAPEDSKLWEQIESKDFASRETDMVGAFCKYGKNDKYIHGMIEYYFPQLKNCIVSLSIFHSETDNLLIRILPKKGSIVLRPGPHYSYFPDMKEYEVFQSKLGKYLDKRLDCSQNIMIIDVDFQTDDRHAQFIIVEMLPHIVNLYLYDPLETIDIHTKYMFFLSQALSGYFGKNKFHMYTDTLNTVKLQTHSVGCSNNVGFCNLFSSMMLYCILSIHSYLKGQIPIYVWGKSVEKVFALTFSPCQLNLLALSFSVVVSNYVASERNYLTQNRYELKKVVNMLVDGLGNSERVRQVYLIVTDPNGPFKFDQRDFDLLLHKARQIKRKRDSTVKIKGRAPY